MENIINSILEIEQNSNKRLEEASKHKNQIIADAKAEEERMISERICVANESLKKIDDDERKVAEQQLVVIEEKKIKEIAILEKVFNERKLIWEDEVFNAIING